MHSRWRRSGPQNSARQAANKESPLRLEYDPVGHWAQFVAPVMVLKSGAHWQICSKWAIEISSQSSRAFDGGKSSGELCGGSPREGGGLEKIEWKALWGALVNAFLRTTFDGVCEKLRTRRKAVTFEQGKKIHGSMGCARPCILGVRRCFLGMIKRASPFCTQLLGPQIRHCCS